VRPSAKLAARHERVLTHYSPHADDDDNEDGGEPKEGTNEAVADEGVTIEEGKGANSGMMHRNPMLADGEDKEDSSENSADEVKAIAEEDEDSDSDQSVLVSILTFDFNELIFGGKDFTAQSAWAVVLLETVIIAAACYILAEAVMLSAKALGVQPYFTAVILGAAASSVPVKTQSFSQPCYSRLTAGGCRTRTLAIKMP
jgi:Ca2+/Na+ antiporter